MKPVNKDEDDELKLVDSINRMTSQLHYHHDQKKTSDQADNLEQTLEELEDQLEEVRSSLETHNHKK